MRLVIFLICSLLIGLAPNCFAKQQDEPLDKLIAVVDESVITQSELDHAIQITEDQLASANTALPPMPELKKKVLDQIINRKLQLELAEKSGIVIKDEEVDKAIQTIAEQNHISVNELLTKVQSQGLSIDEYKKEIHNEITIGRLEQQEVTSRIVISPQEIDDYIRSASYQAASNKEYHLEDLLIALPEKPTAQQINDAKKVAEDILEKIKKGLRFQDAANANVNSGHTLQGGDLGWRKLTEIPSVFSDEIVRMKLNQVSGPMQAPNGFHLVLLSGIRNVDAKLSPKEQRKQIENIIYQRKIEEALAKWITKIRSEAFINLHPES